MTQPGYFTVEAIVGEHEESHTISVPGIILTDAIEDGLTAKGVADEVCDFLTDKIFLTEDFFYLTPATLASIDAEVLRQLNGG
jgi:hypothetical protein|tara:strand:- start:227 stop:475 length:249 start_codon:yes stop_codon:yes gene_type:complete